MILLCHSKKKLKPTEAYEQNKRRNKNKQQKLSLPLEKGGTLNRERDLLVFCGAVGRGLAEPAPLSTQETVTRVQLHPQGEASPADCFCLNVPHPIQIN